MVYKFKLDELILNDQTSVKPKQLTVVLGPNNCGKTKLLKEIVEHFSESTEPEKVVLNDIKAELPATKQDFLSSKYVNRIQTDHTQAYMVSLDTTLDRGQKLGIGLNWEQQVERFLEPHNTSLHRNFWHWFGSSFVSYLSTEKRLLQSKTTELSAEGDPPNSLIEALFNDEGFAQKETAIRKCVKQAFDLDVILDNTVNKQLLFRVSDNFLKVPEAFHARKKFLNVHAKLDDQGDGIKSFVTVILALLVDDRPLILLDEPEAFLHPPQAYQLGRIVGENTRSGRQILVATHSADLIQGMLQTSGNIQFLRMERTGPTNSAQKLSNTDLRSMTQDPLLWSTSVLDGLFYKSAILVESDGDARFYSRALDHFDALNEKLFVSAYGKQAIQKIAKSYGKMGIRKATIVDFDLLNDSGTFRKLATAHGMPNTKIQQLNTQIKIVAGDVESQPKADRLKDMLKRLTSLESRITKFEANGQVDMAIATLRAESGGLRDDTSPWARAKIKGRFSLSTQGKAAFDKINFESKKYGLFIVPVGELESWFTVYGLPYSKNKRKWLQDALALISNLKVNRSHRFWKFLYEIRDYLES